MVTEDDNFVIHGEKPIVPIPDSLLGKFIHDSLLANNVQHECMVDAFTGETRSFQSLLEDTCTLAEALRNYGVTPNTIISISSENSLKFFDSVIASLYVGATVAPINHAYTEEEIRHFLNLYQPKIVFVSRATVEKYLLLKLEFDCIEKLIILQGDAVFGVDNVYSFVQKNLDGVIVDPRKFKPYNEENPVDHIAFILGSSGTTGLPKGVMLTDTNLLVRVAQSREGKYTASPLNGFTTFGLMPFFHGFGLNVTLNAIVNKERVIVLKHFDEDIYLKMIQDYKISTLAVAPPLAVFLAKSPKVDKYDVSYLKEVLCGAAPLSKELEEELRKRLNLTYIRQAYGLTEANLAVTCVDRSNIKKSGSSGTVMPYMSLKVRDPETGKSLGPNQVGEICVKGPMLMKGYHKNPQATKDSFTSDGWLKTGDLGYYDKDQYFFIVDRLKELIKYKGFQVAPAELEAILLNHPKVLDVGVVGAPDYLAGELPVAFVVKKPGVDITEQELIDFVAKKVSPQKRLRGGVFFVNVIPKNASGKILRRELRTKLANLQVKRESKL